MGGGGGWGVGGGVGGGGWGGVIISIVRQLASFDPPIHAVSAYSLISIEIGVSIEIDVSIEIGEFQ